MSSSPFTLRIDDELKLRQRTPEDAEELFALTDANREDLKRWLPWLDHCASSADTLENIHTSIVAAAEGRSLAVNIWYQGRIVGVTGFNSICRTNSIGHIGYWLGREHRGRGIMTRAVQALTAHAFDTLGLNRVAIAAATGNLPSRAIPERLGYCFEGVARGAEWLYDHFVDHAIYALTQADWLSMDRKGQPPRSHL